MTTTRKKTAGTKAAAKPAPKAAPAPAMASKEELEKLKKEVAAMSKELAALKADMSKPAPAPAAPSSDLAQRLVETLKKYDQRWSRIFNKNGL